MNLTKGNIGKQIKQIAIPASIGFFFHTMYNVVDTFYAGVISTQAIAALSLSFPIFYIVLALGTGIGTGTTALISNAIGQKKKRLAGKYAAQGISYSLIASFFLTILGLVSAPYLFKILGASGEYLDISLTYMNIILYGTFSFIVYQACNSVLTSQGDTKSMRNTLIFGFVANLFLNPLFALGWLGFPSLGVGGIALATVLIELVTMCYLYYKVTKTKLWTYVKRTDFVPVRNLYWDITTQGFPSSVNMLTVAVGIFLITYFISTFGAVAVAAYGIATRIEQIFLMPSIGLNIASLTLVGQNNGAKKYARIREIYIKCLKYGLVVSLLGTVITFAIPYWLMRIFTGDQAVIAVGIPYLHIAAFLYFAYVLLFVTVSLYQGLKKPSFGLYIGIVRQIILPLLIFPLFIHMFGWGILGIWWGVFLIIILSSLVVGYFGWRKIGTLCALENKKRK